MILVVNDIPQDVLMSHLQDMTLVGTHLLAWAHVPADTPFVLPEYLPKEMHERWLNQAHMRALTVRRHEGACDVRRARASLQVVYSAMTS